MSLVARVIVVVAVSLAILYRPSSILAATPAPTTSPATTRLADMQTLADGFLRYDPPAGWTRADKADNPMSATWNSPDEHGALIITVTPEDRMVEDSAKERMAMIIGKGIREAAKKENHEIVYQPRVEKDDRFFLKMRDAQKIGDDKIADRIQMYRQVGLQFVHIAATAVVRSLDESRPVHEAAEKLLNEMLLSRGAKRSVYPHTQLRAIVPLDWKELKTDTANGQMAVYTDPKQPARQIIVRSRVIPKVAQSDTAKRDQLLTKMVDEERRMPPLSASVSATSKDDQPFTPGGAGITYLKSLRVPVQRAGQSLVVETRYFVVADVIVSVRTVTSESDAEAIRTIADKYCEDLKPLKD
jgi:hypothetical protein